MAGKRRAIKRKQAVTVQVGWDVWCAQCEKQFKAKRADAKFCSSTCRSRATRERKKGEA